MPTTNIDVYDGRPMDDPRYWDRPDTPAEMAADLRLKIEAALDAIETTPDNDQALEIAVCALQRASLDLEEIT